MSTSLLYRDEVNMKGAMPHGEIQQVSDWSSNTNQTSDYLFKVALTKTQRQGLNRITFSLSNLKCQLKISTVINGNRLGERTKGSL
jgi:hypothetical protein